MKENTSLKQMIQEMNKNENEILLGIVKSINPLKIQIINDEKLIIGANNTYIPKHLTNYMTTVDIASGSVDGLTVEGGEHKHMYNGNTATAEDPEHSHKYNGETQTSKHSHTISALNITGATMTVYNALKVGESVHIMSFNHGKQYYVLDRVE